MTDENKIATHSSCQNCDNVRIIGCGHTTSLEDCESCGTTCCDYCYEDYHAFGPCEPESKWKEK